jgi:hypothetical protein
MVGLRHDIKSQILSLLAYLPELTLMIFVQIILCTALRRPKVAFEAQFS